MLTDALPQLLHFGNKFFTCHLVKVCVHNVLWCGKCSDQLRL
jgi:hypothetical protein